MPQKRLTDSDLRAIKQVVEVTVEEKLENVATKEDIKYLPTKDEFFKRMDKLSKEIEDLRTDSNLAANQSIRHEDRISSLENIHPHGKHTAP